MTEGSELQLGHSGSDEDRGLQELEKELEEIREEIQTARKKQDRQQTLRRQIKEAKKDLAAITGDTRGKITLFSSFRFLPFSLQQKLVSVGRDCVCIYVCVWGGGGGGGGRVGVSENQDISQYLPIGGIPQIMTLRDVEVCLTLYHIETTFNASANKADLDQAAPV